VFALIGKHYFGRAFDVIVSPEKSAKTVRPSTLPKANKS
jgi:hypothetical protein